MTTAPRSSPGRHRRLIVRLLWLVLLVVVTIGLVPALEWGIGAGLQHWLRQQGATAVRIGQVRLQPLDGRLTLGGIEVTTAAGGKLTLAELGGALDWWPLWQRRLRLRALRLERGAVQLRRDADGRLWLGGIPLPVGGADAGPPSHWGWEIDTIDISNTRFVFEDPALARPAAVTIRNFHLGRLTPTEPDRATPLTLAAELLHGTLKLKGTLRPFAQIPALQLHLEAGGLALADGLALAPPAGVQLAGELGSTLDLKLTAAKAPTLESRGRLWLQRPAATRGELSVQADGLTWDGAVRLAQGRWLADGTLQAEALAGKTQDGVTLRQAAATVSGQLQREADGRMGGRFDAAGKQLELARPGAAPVALASWQLQGLSPGAGVKLDKLLTAGGRLGPAKAPVVGFGKCTAGPISWGTDAGLAIDDVHLTGARLALVREAAGLNLARLLAAWLPPAKAPATPAQAPPPLRIDRIRLDGGSAISWRDRTVQPAVEAKLTKLAARLERIDTARPEQASPFRLQAVSGNGGRLQLAGDVTLGAVRPTFSLKGKLQGEPLPPYSPYLARAIGWRLQSGRLDAVVSGRVRDGVADLDSHLQLARLTVANASADGSDAFAALTGMPLQKSLNMLRDGNGDISLKVPISGDLTRPDIDSSQIVATALKNGFTQATVSYFAPLGVQLLTGLVLPPGSLLVAGKLVHWAATVRFDPIPFTPGKAVLDGPAVEQVVRMGELLQQRPEVRLVLCGKAGATEPPPSEPASATPQERLRLLAGQRAQAVRDALIRQGIAAERLFQCEPEVETGATAQPRVEVGA